jgi:hypothetical protein
MVEKVEKHEWLQDLAQVGRGPATRMLGNFKVYSAERLLPSREEIARRRGAAQKPQLSVPRPSTN